MKKAPRKRRRAVPDEVRPARGEATALNPDAGEHAVAADAGELSAVKRAADRAWLRHPYYLLRFGDRGYRFAISDGAWIVTLCDRDARQAGADVLWLNAVLASRGMPGILLREYLHCLHEELVQEVPDRKRRYAFLRRAAARMESASDAVLAGERFTRLAAAFDAATVGEATSVPRFGEILVAAVVDEARGIENAVSSLTRWADDPGRFSHSWISAVEDTIAKTRRAIKQQASRPQAAGRRAGA